MILRNGVFKVERVEQLLLPTLQSPHNSPLSVAHALSSNGITVREYAQRRLLQHYRPQPEIQVVGDDAVHSVRFFRTPNEQLLTIALSRDMLNID
jgi:hypothetical protein